MKRLRKFLAHALPFALAPFLTSCTLHVNGRIIADVHWWVIAIPCALIFLITHIVLLRTTLRCPKCGTEFNPRWYELSVWLHIDDRCVARCPKCGRKGFCERV